MVVKNVCSAWALKQEVKYNQTPVNFSIRVSALSIWCSSALSQPIAGQFCIKTHKHDQRNPLPYKKKILGLPYILLKRQLVSPII